jgi:hypothetical protein
VTRPAVLPTPTRDPTRLDQADDLLRAMAQHRGGSNVARAQTCRSRISVISDPSVVFQFALRVWFHHVERLPAHDSVKFGAWRKSLSGPTPPTATHLHLWREFGSPQSRGLLMGVRLARAPEPEYKETVRGRARLSRRPEG